MDIDSLNPQQLEAVNHVDGPALVLAGAGSGKTRVVTYRISKLIEMGVLPSDTLAVTFTNKAAGEMRKRIEEEKGAHVLACTFHSLGARILRESIRVMGYRSDFTIYDEEDSLKLLKTCFDSLQIKDEKGLLKGVRMQISSAKNDLIPPDQIDSTSLFSQSDKLFVDLYPLYQQKLKEANALDFDDLLYLTVKLLQEHKDVLHEYQNRWLFLLIDEYQDTNFAQYTLTKLLVEKNKNIFAVGDPDQSIYSFRGARYQNILNFDEDFAGAKIITLDQNYRSTNRILHAANAVIEHNPQRYEKNLWSDLGEGEKVGLYVAQNEKAEAEFVMEKIAQHHLDQRIPLNQIVIFYRTNSQSRIFEDALLSRRIPYKVIGGISFYQRKEIKDVLAYLRIVLSGIDTVSFARTINIPKRGIGLTSVHKLVEGAAKYQMPILDFCAQLLNQPKSVSDVSLGPKQKEGLKEYLNIIHSLKETLSAEAKICDLIQDAIEKTGYMNYLKEDPERFEDRQENLEALISKAAEWEEMVPNPSLQMFLEELTLKTSTEEQGDQGAIQMMTLHNGKGLEFELVFVVGLDEDLLPHVNSKDNPESLEEERRLCYVGMTRARKFLYLCSSYYRYMWGNPRLMKPSRFLKEIPVDYLENLSPVNIHSEEEIADVLDDDFIFSEGTRVRHKEFGEGIVQKAYHTSYGPTYDVFFETLNAPRSLVAKYAKLELA